jgi:hypothetical protein
MEEKKELTINSEIACPQCGEMGATGKDGNGPCMKCLGKNIDNSLRIKKSKEYLKCEFIEHEILEFGNELARKHSEITELEEMKKRVVSDFKAKTDAAEAEASILARKIQNKHEYRDVECQEVYNYVDKSVTIVRNDTGEIVKTRDMREDEKQELLFPDEEEDEEDTEERLSY